MIITKTKKKKKTPDVIVHVSMCNLMRTLSSSMSWLTEAISRGTRYLV